MQEPCISICALHGASWYLSMLGLVLNHVSKSCTRPCIKKRFLVQWNGGHVDNLLWLTLPEIGTLTITTAVNNNKDVIVMHIAWDRSNILYLKDCEIALGLARVFFRTRSGVISMYPVTNNKITLTRMTSLDHNGLLRNKTQGMCYYKQIDRAMCVVFPHVITKMYRRQNFDNGILPIGHSETRQWYKKYNV